MSLLPYTVEPMQGEEISSVSRGPTTFDLPDPLPVYIDPASISVLDRVTNPTTYVLVGGGDSDLVEVVPEQFIRGRVLNYDGIGVARTVIAVDRNNGRSLAATTSGGDGWFVIRPRSLTPVLLIAVPLDSEKINAVVLDNILPVPD